LRCDEYHKSGEIISEYIKGNKNVVINMASFDSNGIQYEQLLEYMKLVIDGVYNAKLIRNHDFNQVNKNKIILSYTKNYDYEEIKYYYVNEEGYADDYETSNDIIKRYLDGDTNIVIDVKTFPDPSNYNDKIREIYKPQKNYTQIVIRGRGRGRFY
jgi:hypothetical protein